MQIINASIDCTKITQAKLGNGKYLNLSIIINDEPDKFGNTVVIIENQSKQERESNAKKNYLGNGSTPGGQIALPALSRFVLIDAQLSRIPCEELFTPGVG